MTTLEMTEVHAQDQSLYPLPEKNGPPKPQGSRTTDKLSDERLAKKRAADRHAQRVLREKTKRHIEELEQKVQELSDKGGQESALEAARKRTLELESELQNLRALQALKASKTAASIPVQPDLYTTSLSLRPVYPPVAGPPEIQPPALANSSRFEDVTDYPSLQNSTYGPPSPTQFSKALTNIEDSATQAPWPTYRIPNTFVPQPSVHIWELPLANEAPSNPIDFVMSSVIERQKEVTAVGGKRALTLAKGPRYPNIMALLLPQERTQIHPVSGILSDMLRRLTYRTFVDKVAALLVIYPIFQWQIARDYESYVNLQEYAKPTLLQRSIPHPMWVCAVGWPLLRDFMIMNQALYCNEEFQYMMVHSLNCNWPYGTEAAMKRTREGFTITKDFWDHIRIMDNWTLEEPFQSRYPELEPYCKFSKSTNNGVARNVGPV